MHRLSNHLTILSLLGRLALAYDPLPRWGQASVVVNDALFVFGGKTDQFNSYSYTSAPDTNDLLYLSLSDSFNAEAPSWELVGGSGNTSTSQGPFLSWHTLSAFNTSGVLLFGGLPGPDSQTSNLDAPDSAALLDIFNRFDPSWTNQPQSWSGQPNRRIRHSTATSPSGSIYIFGGERADGSNIGLSDHYVFDPNALSFTLLPASNAPPDLYGHASIILPDGRILVFGGYSQSRGDLVPLSTLWALDTSQSEPSWSTITTATDSLPAPRMAFAATLTSNGRIVIHGGTDASQQRSMDDGWVLDTTQNPMVWSQRPNLTQVGARRDHLAVFANSQVLFAFGYGNNGPATAELVIYNTNSDSISSSFNPSTTSSPTQTLPVPSQSVSNGATRPGATSQPGVHPTSTVSPGGPGGGDVNSDADKRSSRVAVALGTLFGLLGFVVVGGGVVYYARRKRMQQVLGGRQFMSLDDDDEGASTHTHPIPAANMREGYQPRASLFTTLGLGGIAEAAATKMRAVGNNPQRRDMLADEDTRSFGAWYESRRREEAAGSSWSLRSILGGGRRVRSREGSYHSRRTVESAPWREKSDPFADRPSPFKDEEAGFLAPDSRPATRRERSYASSRSARSYHDPFADPIHEEHDESWPAYRDSDVPTQPTVRPVPAPGSSLSPLLTVLPLSQQAPPPLSPLSERTSQSTLARDFNTLGSSHANSSENAHLSPFEGGSTSRATSKTTLDPSTSPPSSPYLFPTSSGFSTQPSQPMKRSDSWWSRFARSSFLDRRSSGASRKYDYDIRDPNPPPMLLPIEEQSIHGGSTPSRISPESNTSPGGVAVPKAAARHYNTSHGKSLTSLRTADTEMIERVGGTMEVVQRVKTRSQYASGSTSSTGGLSVDTNVSGFALDEANVEMGVMYTSPVDIDSASPPHSSLFKPAHSAPWTQPTTSPNVETPKSPSKVASRVQDYERRTSIANSPSSPPPTNTKRREERTGKRTTVDYGLAPRPSLFIANPDRQRSGSGSSNGS